jgi:uncharacterized protein YybS (DUF2232 family)
LKKLIVISGAAYTLGFIAGNLVLQFFLKTNIIQQFVINNTLNYFEANKEALKTFYERFNSSNVLWEDQYTQIKTGLNLLFLHIPSFIITISWVFGYIVILLSIVIAKRAGFNTSFIEPFSNLKLPFSLGIVFVISELIWIGNYNDGITDKWTVLFLNIAWTLGFCFMMQGIALIDFWLKKIGLNGILKFVFYVASIIMISPFVLLTGLKLDIPSILIFAGMLDYLIDFRKLEQNEISKKL